VAAYVWFCLSTEFVEIERCISISGHRDAYQLIFLLLGHELGYLKAWGVFVTYIYKERYTHIYMKICIYIII